jgi:hypothetical protein
VIKSRRVRESGHLVRKGKIYIYIYIYRFLFEKTYGKRTHRRVKCRYEDNIEIDLKKQQCDDVDWTNLAQDRYSGELLWNKTSTLIKGTEFLDQSDCQLLKDYFLWS